MKSTCTWMTVVLAVSLALVTLGCGPATYVETDYYPEVVCPPGSVWDGDWCVVQPGVVVVECPAGTRWVNGACVAFVPRSHPYCPRGTWFDGVSCVWRQVGCPPGYRFDGRLCVRGSASCPRGTFWNGRRCSRGEGPVVGCPAGTRFDGHRCQPAGGGGHPGTGGQGPAGHGGNGGTGSGKPGYKPGDGNKPVGGTVDAPPPGKGMLPAARCQAGQRWDPVSRTCVPSKTRRPIKCQADERWDGSQCVERTPSTPPRRPPATDKPADKRPGTGVKRPGTGDKRPTIPKSCPAGQHWNARSQSCVPDASRQRPPQRKPQCPPGRRCK